MTRMGQRWIWRSMLDCAFATVMIYGVAGGVEQAHAQAADPSANTTVKLIELLIKNGVLSRQQAASLLKQAQQEAAQPARSQPVARANATAKAAVATGAAATAAAPAASASNPAVPPGTVRVTYVPKIVRQQIAAEVKQQVMQEAQEEGWAAPNVMPDWVQRIRISGDLRLRGEGDLFPSGNDPFLPDFNSINNSSNGFDPNGTSLPPVLNTTEDRTRVRIRARLDVAAQLASWMDSEIRIATGNDNSPVSTNQTLGSPGDFSKYSVWLDRAYVKMRPLDWLVVNAGRAPNPFWTTDLQFDDDVNFDGISIQAQYPLNDHISGFLNAGAFPVFNTDFNFGTNSVVKTPSRDSYLFAVQGGGDWKINDDYAAKLGVGYFAFSRVQGELSAPCVAPTAFGDCNTDDTKPPFVQFGNTLMPIRNIVPDPSNPNAPQPQFFGLASQFHVLDVHGRFDIKNFDPINIAIEGDYLKNLAFNRNTAGRFAANNLGANNAYQGGDTGYMVKLTVGHEKLEKLWDWNTSIAYKYLESDATLDALTDSDFHLGGTNAKGYVLTGNLALNKNAWLAGTWLSTNQVSGPTYAVDVLLVDLNAKF
jgi:hypothetical protein